MLVTTQPNVGTHITPEFATAARELGMHPINIICDAPYPAQGDDSGMSFITAVYEIPRIGERILLDDGRICEVQQVVHKVGVQNARSGRDFFLLLPTVYAVLIKKIRP